MTETQASLWSNKSSPTQLEAVEGAAKLSEWHLPGEEAHSLILHRPGHIQHIIRDQAHTAFRFVLFICMSQGLPNVALLDQAPHPSASAS